MTKMLDVLIAESMEIYCKPKNVRIMDTISTLLKFQVFSTNIYTIIIM